MKVLFCPAHYVYDDSHYGSEFSWAYNVAHRISSLFPNSVVVTGNSLVRQAGYRVIELTPDAQPLDFSLRRAFTFNARYTRTAWRALNEHSFDLVHHVLPFAYGKTYNLAALRHSNRTPFVIGPIQPPLGMPDLDVDARDLTSLAGAPQNNVGRRMRRLGAFASMTIAPLALSWLSRKTLIAAAVVVAVNDAAKANLVRDGVPPSRITVIPPGVDTERFRGASARRPDPSGIEFLSASRLVERKNVDLIIKAFARVAETTPDVKLRIVGDGPQRAPLTQLTRFLGIDDKVMFTGVVSNAAMHQEYERADVFVNASAWEGFATTALEALASGLPIVTTRVGGFVDAVEDRKNGYLVSRPTSDELADPLVRLARDSSLVDEFSEHSRERARKEFDWEAAVIPKYLDAYRQALASRR